MFGSRMQSDGNSWRSRNQDSVESLGLHHPILRRPQFADDSAERRRESGVGWRQQAGAMRVTPPSETKAPRPTGSSTTPGLAEFVGENRLGGAARLRRRRFAEADALGWR